MFIYNAGIVRSAVNESRTVKLGTATTDTDLERLRKQAKRDGLRIGTDCKTDVQGVPYYVVFGTPEHLLANTRKSLQ